MSDTKQARVDALREALGGPSRERLDALARIYQDELADARRQIEVASAGFRADKAATTGAALARMTARLVEVEGKVALADEQAVSMRKAYEHSGTMRRIVCDLEAVQEPEGGHVYFLREDGAEYLKIGYTLGGRGRKGEVQVGNPRALTLVAYAMGPAPLEKSMHKVFAVEHHRGEWFRVSERLASFIIEVREEGVPAWILK